MNSNIEVAIREANNALPPRKLRDLIERTDLSADMKAIMFDLVDVTTNIAGKAIAIGRKILTVVLEFMKIFPGVAIGVIIALVLTALISAIPIFGGFLASVLSSVLLLIGVAKGALHDLSNPDLNTKIDSFVSSLSALSNS